MSDIIKLYNQSNNPHIFGWIPEENRTSEQKEKDRLIRASWPEFKLYGNGYWKQEERSRIHECVLALRKKHLPAFYQEVGSCVGQGKAKCEWYLMHVEKVLKGDREIPILPYEPYGYAQSRVCGGISGMQDGSFGSAAAEAAKKYGVLSSELQGLPAFKTNGETITWPGKIDREWGNRGAPSQWITEGQKHLVRTTAVLKNHDDAVAALANGYPITIASDWGGMMTPPIVSGVRLNKRVTQWMHQMMISDFWFHPQLGLIFYVNNSWGENAHGDSPDGSPPGGFWITKDEFNYIARQNEAIAYSDLDGFEERRLDKALFMLYS